MSEAEIGGMQLDMVLRMGVSPERIVFANACKRPRDIKAAANKQVLQPPMARQQARGEASNAFGLSDHHSPCPEIWAQRLYMRYGPKRV